MSLLTELIEQYDGKHVTYLEEYATSGLSQGQLNELINQMTASLSSQVVCTWILKRWREAGGSFSREQSQQILIQMSDISEADARLHLLQLQEYLVLEPDDAPKLHDFLELCLASEHTFVRAWAYGRYSQLLALDAQYIKQAKEALKRGLKEERASVKVQVRKLQQSLNNPTATYKNSDKG